MYSKRSLIWLASSIFQVKNHLIRRAFFAVDIFWNCGVPTASVSWSQLRRSRNLAASRHVYNSLVPVDIKQSLCLDVSLAGQYSCHYHLYVKDTICLQKTNKDLHQANLPGSSLHSNYSRIQMSGLTKAGHLLPRRTLHY